MSENAKKSDFKDRILPHLEGLLQFSLWLAKDGRGAIRLMQEALAEAFQSWDDSTSEESCDIQLHHILTRRFLNGGQQGEHSLTPVFSDTGDESAGENDRYASLAITNARQQSWLTGESDEDVNYFVAFAGLPPAFRSAMILSYLEGFSSMEIANLAGVQPPAVESLLNRGHKFLREELFAHLMGDDCLDTVDDQEAATG